MTKLTKKQECPSDNFYCGDEENGIEDKCSVQCNDCVTPSAKSNQKYSNKREYVRKAYGKYWEIHKDNVDENGWSYLGNNTRLLNDYDCSLVGEWQQKGYDPFKTGENSHIQQVYVRPKSLQGMENNNGWFSIEEHGFPSDDTVEYENISSINGLIGKTTLTAHQVYLYHNAGMITHYRPVTKQVLPLY